MKHFNKLRVTICAATVVVAVVFFACKKEKTTAVETYGNTETISKEDNMSAYLKQFKEKMKSSAKGGETLSLDDAQWHLEAVLNYTYGDAGHQVSDIQCDTFYYTIRAEENEVPLYQLNEAFNAFSQNVEKAFEECNLPEKSILAIQTSFDNNRDGNVTARTILTTRGYRPGAWPPRFGATDYWDAREDLGKCGPYEGECVGRGAITELTRMANLRIPGYSCSEGYRTYHVNYFVDAICAPDCYYLPDLQDENSPSGCFLYDLWEYNTSFYGELLCPFCLHPDAMNYYLDKSQAIIAYLQPIGKHPVSCRYFWDEWLGVKEEKSGGFHCIEVTYAEIHCEYVGYDQ